MRDKRDVTELSEAELIRFSNRYYFRHEFLLSEWEYKRLRDVKYELERRKK